MPELALMPIVDVKELATSAVSSGMFPALKTKESAFVLMMICQSEGLHPIQALRRYDIIEGKPALKTDAMLGDFQKFGGSVEWHEHTHEKVSATFTAPGIDKPVTVTWTMDDAKRAGLNGKGTWQKYPRQMLRARVVSEGIRMAMPAVVAGIYTPEEVQDFDDRPALASVPAPKAITVEVVPVAEAPAPKAPDAVKSAPAPTTGKTASPPSDPLATPAQVRALHAALGRLLPKHETEDLAREAKLGWISWKLGRKVETSKDVTQQEMTTLIGAAVAGEVAA